PLISVPGNPAHTDLAVVDLRVPTAPSILGRITVLGGGLGVKVLGSLAYVSTGSAGLQIVDVSNPSVPRILATRDTPGVAWDVAVANGYAYVADDTSVQVIDVRTPSNPVIVGSLATPADVVAVAGSRLYALSYGRDFKIIDVTNPAAPSLLSTSASFGAADIAVVGSAAY